MLIKGKLVDEGVKDDTHTFVFYGYNPFNGEPCHPIEINVEKDSPSIPNLLESCEKEESIFELNPNV